MIAAGRFRAVHLHGAVLVLAPFLRGGFPGWAIVAITAAATVSFAVTRFRHHDVSSSPAGPDWLVRIMWVAVGYTALQGLPLPCGLVAVLSPDAVDHARASAALLGDARPICTLSHDPGHTHAELLKGLAIAQIFLGARILARAGERRTLQYAVVAATLAMALGALAVWFSQDDVMRLAFNPVPAHVPALTPLVNMNTLGGFTGMGVPLCLGLALQERSRQRRPLWYVAATTLAVVVLMSRSRGAVAALLEGTLLVSGLTLFRMRRRRHPGRTMAGPPVGPFAGILILPVAVGAIVYLGIEGVYDDVTDSNTSKLAHIAAAFEFSLRHPVMGVGRGAFASAFRNIGAGRAFHVESFPIQWGAEWGWPLTIALIAITAASLARVLPGARPAQLGAVSSVVALGTQNLVDLGSELLGIAVVAASVFGTVTARRTRRTALPGDGMPPSPGRTLWLPLVSLGALLLLGPGTARYDYSGSVARLRRLTGEGDGKQFHSTLRAVLWRHPAEPSYPLLAAADAMRRAPRDAGAWLNRAMTLAPGWDEPHVQAAFWLARLGATDQALLEVRAAAATAPSRAARVFCAVVGQAPDQGRVAAATPVGSRRMEFLDAAVKNCLMATTPVVAEIVDRRLIADGASIAGPWVRQASRELSAGHLASAEKLTRAVRTRFPEFEAGIALGARILLAQQRYDEAVALLEAGLQGRSGGRTALLHTLAEVHAAKGDADGMRRAVHRLIARQSRGAATARAYHLLGQLEQSLHNRGKALAAFQRAVSIDESPGRLRSLATAALAQDRRSLALRALSRLCEIEPANTWACRQKNALTGSAFR